MGGGAPAVPYGLGQKRAFITWERFFVLGLYHMHPRLMMLFFPTVSARLCAR